MSAIETELLQAIGKKKLKSGDRQVALKDLIESVKKLSDQDWEDLSDPAGSWVNEGVKVLDADENGEIADFPDNNEEESEVVEQEKKPTKKTAAKGDKKPDKKKAATDKKPEKVAKSDKNTKAAKEKPEKIVKKPSGAQVTIKQMILDDPKITTEDLLAKLSKKGLTPTKLAVSTIRSGMLQTLRIIKDAGHLKGVDL